MCVDVAPSIFCCAYVCCACFYVFVYACAYVCFGKYICVVRMRELCVCACISCVYVCILMLYICVVHMHVNPYNFALTSRSVFTCTSKHTYIHNISVHTYTHEIRAHTHNTHSTHIFAVTQLRQKYA